MNSNIGNTINCVDFAQKGHEIHDTILVSEFSRLRDLLESTDGAVNYQLIGQVSGDNQLELDLKVQGSLSLICQRCLESFDFALNLTTIYRLVPNEEAIPPDDEGEMEYLVADEDMHVFDLIEDEILLALPLAPKHPIEKCKASDEFKELKKPSPFAVLVNLKAVIASGKG